MTGQPGVRAGAAAPRLARPDIGPLLRYFLYLGSLGFGGPVALVGYMQRDLVERRGWFTRDEYTKSLALAQLAPGPLAAQLAICLGYVHSRARGATLVSDPEQADLVLEGSVQELRVSARSFSSIAFALEYSVEMRLHLFARRSDGTQVRIDPSALREVELYLTSADVEAEHKNRDEALRRLAALLASRVHESLANRLAAAQ